MKVPLAVLFAATLALAPAARADDQPGQGAEPAHQHGDAAPAAEHEHEHGDAAGSAEHDHGAGGEGGHDMAMHEKHMKEMQDLLAKIKAAPDAQEKERLVQQFVDAEQEHEKQMHGMMDKMQMQEKMQDKMQEKPQIKPPERLSPKRGRMGMKGAVDPTEKRLDMIDKRLEAVQGLLERLVHEHEAK